MQCKILCLTRVLQSQSPFAVKLHTLTASPVVASMASLSAMFVQVLSALSDSRTSDAWIVMSETLQRLDMLTGVLESDWLRSPLAAVSNEDSIGV